MKYKTMLDGSYLHNFFLRRRNDEPSPYLFRITENRVNLTAFLNGYAIIPLEEYYKLIGEKYLNSKFIKQADKELHTGRK